MKNSEEHQKILKQVADLEKNSINYFDVEKEFLLIDSDNLSQIRPRFYGYSIQRDGIYEEENLTPEAIANLNGRGCYICVDVKDNEITIKQDLNGCWGIYLFRHGNYFALSTSFFRLLDHLKFKYPLTVNRDYCNYISIDVMCSISCNETAVNEINVVDRSAILHIDRSKKDLEIELIDYKEHSVSPDSKEGIDILDNWIDFWSNFFRRLIQNTKFIQADLSGGFDSRVALVPLIYSGADLNQITIHSKNDAFYTHVEDYAIATQIAEHYGFKLNQPLPQSQELNYSFFDVFNKDLYSRQIVTNLPNFASEKGLNKVYAFNGFDGETVRNYWYMPMKEFAKTHNSSIDAFPCKVASELARSFESILDSNSRIIRDKYKIEDENSADISQLMFYDTWSRYHFGKVALIGYFSNGFSISPISDPELRTLNLFTSECTDPNLLIALIFTRYAPDLLKFKFQGSRQIAPATIEYARKINERFPIVSKCVNSVGGVFHLQPRDKDVEEILKQNKNNPNILSNFQLDYLKAVFDSSRTYGLFTSYFDSELYRYATSRYEIIDITRARRAYAIVGVAKVIEDVEISQHNHLTYHYAKDFLDKDFSPIPQSINPKLLPYITGHIDIILISPETEKDFKLISISDAEAIVKRAIWSKANEFFIQSWQGKLEFTVKSTANGQFMLLLRGVYTTDEKMKKIPYWIDYTNLTINDNVLLDTLTPTCHYQCLKAVMDVKSGEEIKIKVEWLPHRSDT